MRSKTEGMVESSREEAAQNLVTDLRDVLNSINVQLWKLGSSPAIGGSKFEVVSKSTETPLEYLDSSLTAKLVG